MKKIIIPWVPLSLKYTCIFFTKSRQGQYVKLYVRDIIMEKKNSATNKTNILCVTYVICFVLYKVNMTLCRIIQS